MTTPFEKELQALPQEAQEELRALVANEFFKVSARESFDEHDADKNGTLCKTELRVAVEAMYGALEEETGSNYKTKVTEEIVAAVAAEFDTNQDGKLDASEYEEFCKLMTVKLFQQS